MQKDELIKNLRICSGELEGSCDDCTLRVKLFPECRSALMKESAETIYNIFEIIRKLYKL